MSDSVERLPLAPEDSNHAQHLLARLRQGLTAGQFVSDFVPDQRGLAMLRTNLADGTPALVINWVEWSEEEQCSIGYPLALMMTNRVIEAMVVLPPEGSVMGQNPTYDPDVLR